MPKLSALLLLLAVATPLAAQSTEALNSPSSTSPGAAVAGCTLNQVMHGGAAALGITIDTSTDVIIVNDLFTDIVFTYNLDLTDAGSFTRPGLVATTTGVAYNPNTDTLFFVEVTTGTLYETETDGTVVNIFNLATPGGGLAAGLTYDPVNDTLRVDDLVNDLYYEMDLTGTPTATPSFPNPDDAGTGAFGNGVTHVTGSLFDVPSGRIDEGQVSRIYRVDATTGVVTNEMPVSDTGDGFINGIVYHATGSTGAPVHYVVGNATNQIFELDANLPNGCSPVTDLACTFSGLDASLTFTNNGPYDSIEIFRDCDVVPIATLAGTATSFADSGLTEGAHSYRVESVAGADRCGGYVDGFALDLPAGLTDIIFGPDAGTTTDSTAALQFALDSIGRVPYITAGIKNVDLSAAEAVWVAAGTFPDNEQLTLEEGQALVDFVLSGTGASPKGLYVTGGDVWFFDIQTALTDFDGTEGLSDGPELCDITDLIGLAPGTLDLTMAGTGTLSGECSFIDRLAPETAGAAAAQTDGTGTITTAIFLDGAAAGLGEYRAFCSATEFAGFDGDQGVLAQAIIDGFDLGGGGGPMFVRGDTNSDGTFDISDAVFTLTSLFVSGGAAPTCDDAADSNDDGGVDISDAVYTLGALFVSGSPVPPAPHPACGEDATPGDTLDCVSFPPCP